MNQRRYIGYRAAWAVVASLLVTFVLFVLASSIGDLTSGAPTIEQSFPDVSTQYWDPSDPVYQQYFDWLVSLVTLEWGTSMRFGEPVTGLLLERVKYTAAYLIPGVVLGTIVSTAFGYLSARRQGTLFDGTVRGTTYLVLAVPNFLLAAAVTRYLEGQAYGLGYQSFSLDTGLLGGWNPYWLGLAAAILGTHVAATQLRQVRAQSREYFSDDFVQTLHAKGVGPLRFARHILRAAAVPLLSLFVAEVVGLLLVSVFVIEAVIGIEGIGYIMWKAAAVNDVPLVMTTTFLVALIIIVASLFEDISSVLLDPRMDDEF